MWRRFKIYKILQTHWKFPLKEGNFLSLQRRKEYLPSFMPEFENNYPQSNRSISKMNWNLHIVRVTLRELTGLTIWDSRTKIFYWVIYFINSNENAKTVLTLSISKTVLLSPKKFHITHVCMCLPGWDSPSRTALSNSHFKRGMGPPGKKYGLSFTLQQLRHSFGCTKWDNTEFWIKSNIQI